MRAAPLMMAALCCAACGDAQDGLFAPDARPLGDGQLEAGGANDDGSGFITLADGSDATLAPGSQGGFHVWVNVRVQGVAGQLYLEREARRASDGALVLAGSRRALEIPPDAMDDWWTNPQAAPSFMCPAPLGIRVYDEPLLFTLTLTDRDERLLATDQIVLIPRCPTDDEAAFCADICAG